MIKVLHELASLDGGGVARLLYDYYCNIDHEKVHFDFLIYDYFEEGILERPLREMGCRIFKISRVEAGKKLMLDQMDKVFEDNEFDIIHSHRGPQGYYVLSCAKKHGIKKRIVHSHLVLTAENFQRRVKNAILLTLDKNIATDLMACGRDAAISMWGRKNYESGKVHIMKNAIDAEKFRFSQELRETKRAELGVSDSFVLGIVGRLEEQKNHKFLIQVFSKVVQKNKNAVLLMIGRGSREEELLGLCKDLQIEDKVRFLGVRDDVSELLNAIDLFVLPSFFEGLPVVLVEAQANGVKEIVSSSITDEMAVTDLIDFVPIDSEDLWVEKILGVEGTVSDREKYADIIEENGYGIKNQAHKLEEFYISRGRTV